jgi:hypothetical protein
MVRFAETGHAQEHIALTCGGGCRLKGRRKTKRATR